MSEHEHSDHHEQTQPIEANVPFVPDAETGEIDVEALKREWSAEWQRLLQTDIRSLRDYNPQYMGDGDWVKLLRQFLNYNIVQIRLCGQDFNSLNNILRGLRDTHKWLTNRKLPFHPRNPRTLFPLKWLITNDKDQKIAEELLSFAIDFMKQYTDSILSLPKPALGSDEELLRPASGTGSGDVANLVRPAKQNGQPSDDLE